MSDKKQKRPPLIRVTTEKGVAVFPKLNTPDEYKGKTTYNTKLNLPGSLKFFVKGSKKWEDARPLVEELIEAEYETQRAKLEEIIANSKGDKKAKAEKKLSELSKDNPFRDVYDDDDERTGEVQITAKMNAFYLKKVKDKDGNEVEKKVPLTPSFFDAKGREIKPGKVPEIWSGSVLKLSFDLNPYYVDSTNSVGVSFRLAGVQIIDLVTRGGGRTADSMGFGEEDGGFDSSANDGDDDEDGDDDASPQDDDDEDDDDATKY